MEKEIALICTTYNCKQELVDSLQTFTSPDNLELLDEFVIVDGGSTDGTWELLTDWAKRVDKLKIYQVPGANISCGRNEAIKRTKAGIIVGFDSGTRYGDNWLKLMLEPFNDPNVDIVGGSTVTWGESRYERCLAFLSVTKTSDILFNPSHRGVAYKRKVWERIGGYPEHVKAGEDSWFNARCKKLGHKYINVPQAKNYWRVRKNWTSTFKTSRRNIKGHMTLGAEAGWKVIVFIVTLNIFCVLCLILGFYNYKLWLLGGIVFLLYSVRRFKRRWKYFTNPLNFLVGLYALMALDFGTVAGALEGTTLFLKQKIFSRGNHNER